jgi:hypothetical protein
LAALGALRRAGHYLGRVTSRPTPLVLLSAISVVQGIFLLGYAAFDIVEAFRTGITGPEEVSNPMALLGLIVITALFGASLVWLGVGFWQGRSWARSPFIVAQLVLGLIGYEISQSRSDAQQTLGQAAMVIAVVGIVLVFLPSVRRVFAADDMPNRD